MTNIVSNRISILRSGVEIKIIATDDGINFFKTDGITGADILMGTLALNGSSIRLLNAVTGTPTSNATIVVERGASTDAGLVWDETSDDWQAGLIGATRSIVRRVQQDITNASLTAGSYTLTHNLGKYPHIQVINNSNELIGMTVTHTDVNTCIINFNNVLVSGLLVGTWRIIAEA